MKFTTAAASLLFASASATTVSYDEGYDDASRSLAVVSCSDGSNGLLTKGYTTQGSVPGFPNIGGTSEVAGWNSPQCGACYEVTYNGQTIHIVAVDHTDNGLNLSKAALNSLTNGRAEEVGRVDATVTRVDSGVCGLRASKRTIEFMG